MDKCKWEYDNLRESFVVYCIYDPAVMNNVDFEHIVDDGFKFCPYCGKEIRWIYANGKEMGDR